jgi:hypothetical protein
MIKLSVILHNAIAEIAERRAKAKIELNNAIAKIEERRAKSEISYNYAKAAVILISLRILAREFTEAVGLAEVVARAFGKNISDQALGNDVYSSSISKPKTDDVSLTERIPKNVNKPKQDGGLVSESPVKGHGKNPQDSIALGDIQSQEVGKGLTELPQITDALALQALKSLTDQAGVNDTPSKGPAKSFAESVGFTDQLLIAKLFIRAFTESPSASDDDRRMDFHKFITEGLFATDDLDGEATAQDDQEMSFVKVRTELASLSDSPVREQVKSKSDTIASTDSGSLRGQGYAEFGYFLEDYVGYSRSF